MLFRSKAYIYTGDTLYGARSLDAQIFNGTKTSGQESEQVYTECPNKSGSYYFICELYIRGSDYLLAKSLQSESLVVNLPISPSGGPGGSPAPTGKLALTVIVITENGTFIKDASVAIYDYWNVTAESGSTNIYGEYLASLYSGEYNIFVQYGDTTKNQTIMLTESRSLTFTLAIAQIIPPMQLFIETNSLILVIIGIVSLFTAFYFERKKMFPYAITMGIVGVSFLMYGGAVTARIVKPFWMYPPFTSIALPFISLPSVSLPSFDFSWTRGITLTNELMIVFATLAICVPIITYALYIKYKPIKHAKRKHIKSSRRTRR